MTLEAQGAQLAVMNAQEVQEYAESIVEELDTWDLRDWGKEEISRFIYDSEPNSETLAHLKQLKTLLGPEGYSEVKEGYSESSGPGYGNLGDLVSHLQYSADYVYARRFRDVSTGRILAKDNDAKDNDDSNSDIEIELRQAYEGQNYDDTSGPSIVGTNGPSE